MSFDPYGWPITGDAFGLAVAICVVASLTLVVVRLRRRRTAPAGTAAPWRRWLAIGLVLLLVEAAWGVNAYFDYLPNLGALVGRSAADEVPTTTLTRQLVVAKHVPTHGEVLQVDIHGVDSHFPRAAEIYLPPAWFRSPRPDLPVIEMLAGTPGTPEDWTRSAFADLISDRFAARNDGRAPILIMPDDNGPGFFHDSECVDGKLGHAETYLTDDVTNWADRHIEPFDQSGRWGIGGLSEGGYSAAELALRHPDQYTLFLDFGGLDEPTHPGGPGVLFAGSPARVRHEVVAHELVHLMHGPSADRVAGWFEVGTDDGATTRAVVEDAGQSHSLADSVLVVSQGGHHTFRVWSRAFADSLAWAANRLGLGSCSHDTRGRVETHPCGQPDPTRVAIRHDRNLSGPHRPHRRRRPNGPFVPVTGDGSTSLRA